MSATLDFKQHLTKQPCSVTNFLIYKPEYAMQVWAKDSLTSVDSNCIIFDVYDFMIAFLYQKEIPYVHYGKDGVYIKHPVTKQYIPMKEMEKVCGFFGTPIEKITSLWARCASGAGRIQMFAAGDLSRDSKKWKVFQEHTTVPLFERKSCCTIL